MEKTIERVEISRLIKDPNNARKHDKKNLEAIKGSLAKFGQQKPIVVNMNDIVVAGNGTLEAANQLGWTHIDIVRTDLEGFNAAAYALADNRTSELGAWNDDVLGSQLLALQTDGFDLAAIGFDAGDDFKPDLPDDDKNFDLKEDKLSITIQCKSLDEHQELFDELNNRGYKVKI
jgi:ParB-like chromosome segregation protein Spo0J